MLTNDNLFLFFTDLENLRKLKVPVYEKSHYGIENKVFLCPGRFEMSLKMTKALEALKEAARKTLIFGILHGSQAPFRTKIKKRIPDIGFADGYLE